MFDRSTPAAVTNGSKWAAPAILCGLAILVVFTLRAVIVAEGDMLPGRDSVNLYVWEIYTRAVLVTGTLPFWNPLHFAGTPHLADVQTTVLYPPAMLLRWLPPGAFLSWMAALHVWIAGAGVLFLARAIGLGWLASTAVAVAGMLGGSAGARLHNGHLLLLYCAAWLPWALGFAIVSARRATIWPHPGLVIVLALQFLAGYVQGSFYLVGVVCLYYIYCVVWPESPGEPGSRTRALGQLVVAGVLSLGISAFQLFPTARLVAQAARFAGIPYEDAIEGGWYARNLLSFFFPFYGITSNTPHRELAEAVSYVGWVLTPMIPFAFVHSARRRIAVFLAVIAGIALAVASVDLPFYRLHHAIFPGFRFPGRILFLATLSLAVLGGIGLERFIALASARRWRPLALGLIPGALAIAAAAVIVLSSINQRPPAPAWPWLPVVALVGVVAAGALAGRARTTIALAIALALVATDIAAFTSGAMAPVSVESTDTVRHWMGPPNPGRAISTCENRISAGEMLRNGQPGLDGLAGIMLNYYSDWADVASSGNPLPHDGQFHGIDTEGVFPARRDLLDAANVALIFSCAPLEAPSLTLVSHIDGIYAYRNDAARPRAFWTCEGQMMTRAAATERILRSRFDHEGRLLPRAYINVRWASDVADDRRHSIERARGLEDGVAFDDRTWRYSLEDPSTVNVLALLSDAAVEDTHGVDRITGAITPAPAGVDDGAKSAGNEMVTGTLPCAEAGTVDVTMQDQLDGRLMANVQAPQSGYVFLSEALYSEREAFVDGQHVTPVRANLAFTAVPVPAGSHQLELVYTPTSFRLGLGVSVLTIMMWVGLSRRQRVR
ncbi:MAG TPA: YfhO family protein [Vicinamibacterales bacterium]|nr:YfhO family protein [Vicinamibacterales bacterium]